MLDTIQNKFNVLVSQIYDALTHTGNFIQPVAYTALALTLITSIALLYIMMKFRGKRRVDVAVILREFAIALVIVRVFVALAFGFELAAWGMLIYLFLFVSCAAVLFFSVKEHWFSHNE